LIKERLRLVAADFEQYVDAYDVGRLSVGTADQLSAHQHGREITMTSWLVHVGVSVGQTALSAVALWAWGAMCETAITRWAWTGTYITASRRVVLLSIVSGLPLVVAATLSLHYLPRIEFLDIHRLAVPLRYIWWYWSGLLLYAPCTTVIKLVKNRAELRDEAQHRGVILQVEPRWVKILEKIGEVLLDGSNYVGRS
jgi:hypothetical protein